MLYPYSIISPQDAAQTPPVIPPGNLAMIPLDMSSVQMMQIMLAQASFTEDFCMRAWISIFPAGPSVISPLPDVIPIVRVAPRPLVIYRSGQTPPDDVYLAPVQPGQYYLNVLNLTNTTTRVSFLQTILA